ncbi:uncharacterized protein BO97DRAFT_260796 [Aspergillus homomorphus CBS 101889]|uniref:Uncharacterized protein n=1 Tax=Aspergillus homomorphus (strain CBS 101889) TaxID=1450537 RepID=A0A395I5B7_ASPHC|nr:hypothetical protein BO97DRAFT_260796 [Aspergillus homomorphus CBS 101889]RAL14939.1 hypothetical protein BO97DRAFT_260796 [Aspergillus homomorphus CBS 101889]
MTQRHGTVPTTSIHPSSTSRQPTTQPGKIHLPSVNPPQHYSDFMADVAHTRAEDKAITDGPRVLVFVHPYESLPANEAVQQMMIEETTKSSGMRTESADASHVPVYSQTDD